MYIPLLSVARGHPPPHCENTQVLREAITEDDDDDDVILKICNILTSDTKFYPHHFNCIRVTGC